MTPPRVRAVGRVATSSARSTAALVRARAKSRRRRGRCLFEGVPELPCDPFDRAVMVAAEPWWMRVHERGPLHRSTPRDMWIVTGHAEVRAALRAHDALSSAEGILPAPTRVPTLIAMDRPDHARLRRLLARDFTRDRIERFRPFVEREAARRIDAMLAADVVDAREALAGPLPIDVIAEVLGIPREDRGRFRAWSDAMVSVAGPAGFVEIVRTTGVVLVSTTALMAYFEQLIERRRGHEGEDVLSRLLAEEAGGTLTTDEVFWFAILLLLAGNETTTSLTSATFHAFANDPSLLERLRDEPAQIPAAVEELLRWSSPVQAFFRTTTAPYAVGAHTIPAGERVMLSFGAANHDPARWPEPGRVDLDRDASDHLAFGSGIHFCLGSHLARLEAAVVLEQLVERVREVRPAGPVAWTPNVALRQLARVPVRLTSA